MIDLTQGTEQEKTGRAKKMMLWFAIISLFMMFAGLLSAYIVSSKREDWVSGIQIPSVFYISTLLIMVSSITIHLSYTSLLAKKESVSRMLLMLTFLLGVGFIICQFVGFQTYMSLGYYFTGQSSQINTSFIYIIAFLHILHVVGGLLVLLVLIYNHFKQRYSNGQTLGFELGVTFWHFLDVLWLVLILFFYFF